MKKKIFKAIFLLTAIVYANISMGQTTTFDYLNTTLSTNCNVFNPPLSISAFTHSSLAGGVNFSTSTGLFLGTTPTSSP